VKQIVSHAAGHLATQDVAVIILCWRNREHLPRLLRSLAAQRTVCRLQVVVCHNEVQVPGALGLLSALKGQSDLAGLELAEIFTGGNLGYGGGNNFAIEWLRQRASPRYFLVLNSDVVLHEQALEAALHWADAHPQVAVVGAVHDDPLRPGYRCYGGSRYWRAFSWIAPNTRPDEPSIDYVHGAATLIRASAFQSGAVYAEHYFLFFEELELAERVRTMGMRLGWCPGFRVSHYEGGSRRLVQDDFVPEVAEYFENLNALRFTRDHHPHLLLTVLLFRCLAKPAWLTLCGRWLRLRFWALAVGDFVRGRVRRFGFQKGWQLPSGRDRLVDARLPMFGQRRP
jgi:GT2 family glycosyltransferase